MGPAVFSPNKETVPSHSPPEKPELGSKDGVTDEAATPHTTPLPK